MGKYPQEKRNEIMAFYDIHGLEPTITTFKICSETILIWKAQREAAVARFDSAQKTRKPSISISSMNNKKITSGGVSSDDTAEDSSFCCLLCDDIRGTERVVDLHIASSHKNELEALGGNKLLFHANHGKTKKDLISDIESAFAIQELEEIELIKAEQLEKKKQFQENLKKKEEEEKLKKKEEEEKMKKKEEEKLKKKEEVSLSSKKRKYSAASLNNNDDYKENTNHTSLVEMLNLVKENNELFKETSKLKDTINELEKEKQELLNQHRNDQKEIKRSANAVQELENKVKLLERENLTSQQLFENDNTIMLTRVRHLEKENLEMKQQIEQQHQLLTQQHQKLTQQHQKLTQQQQTQQQKQTPVNSPKVNGGGNGSGSINPPVTTGAKTSSTPAVTFKK